MRATALLWLTGWALFGLPWTSFDPHPHLRRVNLRPFEQTRTRDQLRNFAYYLPFGLLGVGLGWRATVVVAGAGVLSGTTELTQVFSTARYPSVTDVILNLAGATCGVMFALGARRLRALQSDPPAGLKT
jgi:VanZ family protein